jgi:hypothetical protein
LFSFSAKIRYMDYVACAGRPLKANKEERMLSHPGHLIARHRRVLVAGLLAIAAILAIILLLNGSGTTARASAPMLPSYAAYTALSSTESPGLTVATPGSPAALAAKGPVFPANPPGGMASHGPLVASIRRLPIALPTVSAWIAKSADGGICVLVSRHESVNGTYPLGISCEPAPLSESGATSEIETDGRKTVTVGAVPDGVSSVRVAFTDGSSETVRVSRNAWALESDAHIANTRNVVGG